MDTVHSEAGTKLPIYAIYTISPTVFIKTDFPEPFTPEITHHHISESKSKSFATN